MVSLYKIEKDKYGLYYVSYGKKHRIKTLEKHNEKIQEDIDKLLYLACRDGMAYSYMKRLEDMLYNYKIVTINDNQYIQWG